MEGTVRNFLRGGCAVLVETPDGMAILDINVDWLPEINIGDQVDLDGDDGGFFILNGQIISTVENGLTINGQHFENPEK
jgi:hypothetical protein